MKAGAEKAVLPGTGGEMFCRFFTCAEDPPDNYKKLALPNY